MESNTHCGLEPTASPPVVPAQEPTLQKSKMYSKEYEKLKKHVAHLYEENGDLEEQIKTLLGIVTEQGQEIGHLRKDIKRLFSIAYNKEEPS